MKKEKLNKGMEQIKKITMTDDEKNQMLQWVFKAPSLERIPTPSPFVATSYTSVFKRNRVLLYVVASCLVIILSGKGIVFASENSLPGDILYPIKVNIVEPVHAALTFSDQAKAEYESSLATKRLKEAESLARENKLNTENQAQLAILLERHTKTLNDNLDKLNKDKSSESVDNIVTNFQAEMNAHAQVLDIIISNKNPQSKPDDSQISKTARSNGITVRENFDNSQQATDKYDKRKSSVQSLLDSTATDLNDIIPDTTSGVKQGVLDETHKTIDQAKQLLKDADTEDSNQDSKSAYKTLLNSETSAKQASILLKIGLGIDGNNKDTTEQHKNRDNRNDSDNGDE